MATHSNANLTADRQTFVTHLSCALEGTEAEADTVHTLSPAGRPYWVHYDLDAIKSHLDRDELDARPNDLWRYREMLPVRQTSNIVSLGEIETPLVALSNTEAKLGLPASTLTVKDEGRLPTGSFKARGLVMAASMAKEFGLKTLAMPTNGNAGAALSAYASRAGIDAIILCPDNTPEVNVREIAAQGARVYRVNGLIDECGKLVRKGCDENGWFDLSTLKEPYRIEGKKTMGLELAQQMGWQVPDVIFYPTGGGTGLIGMWKAFRELKEIGFLSGKLPRMVAVQSTGCAPIVRAFESGDRHAPRWENAETVASGIRVPSAVGDFMILDAVRESGGFAIAVPDGDILDAVDQAATVDGFLLCPEGGATLAAYKQALAEGLVSRDERAVLFNCATGLKYPMPEASLTLDQHADIDFAAL
ncbi:MAG: threonine synthase [Pseudomonadota bacterium]